MCQVPSVENTTFAKFVADVDNRRPGCNSAGGNLQNRTPVSDLFSFGMWPATCFVQ
jgi:hypothetical protein